ncbi:MAG TPA: hypothetical protein VK419_04500 [Bryobacteraceae bacterium]|nr:hypothetical protein [Bryobacteraceae bacterium]
MNGSWRPAKPGEAMTITGAGLDDKKVGEVYWADHKPAKPAQK